MRDEQRRRAMQNQSDNVFLTMRAMMDKAMRTSDVALFNRSLSVYVQSVRTIASEGSNSQFNIATNELASGIDDIGRFVREGQINLVEALLLINGKVETYAESVLMSYVHGNYGASLVPRGMFKIKIGKS